METLNTQRYDVTETSKQSKFDNITNDTQNKIRETIAKDATAELAEIFGLNKEQVKKLTQKETNEISDTMEVNNTEAQLAKMFGKYEELMNLEKENNKQPISLASVMEEFDRFESVAA